MEKKSDDMIFGVSGFISFTAHVWIFSAWFHYYEPPAWVLIPALMTAFIPFVLLASYVAYWLRRWEEKEQADSADAAGDRK